MEAKKFRLQAWIGSGIIVLSFVVFGIVAYFLVGDIGTQVSAIAQDRSGLASQSAMINAYSTLKGSASSAAVYQAAMDKLLSTQDNLIGFPSQVDNIAHNDGVDLTFSFDGSPVPATANTPGYIGFNLNGTGALSSIILFLKDMESSAPILLSKINSFDLTQSGSNYTVTAAGRVFFK